MPFENAVNISWDVAENDFDWYDWYDGYWNEWWDEDIQEWVSEWVDEEEYLDIWPDNFRVPFGQGYLDSNVLDNDASLAQTGPRQAVRVTEEDIDGEYTLPDNLYLAESEEDSNPTAFHPDYGPSHGTLSFSFDGNFTYTPNLGFAGIDEFTYHIAYTRTNGKPGLSNRATVTIHVDGVSFEYLKLSHLPEGGIEPIYNGVNEYGDPDHEEDYLSIQPGEPIELHARIRVEGPEEYHGQFWNSFGYRLNRIQNNPGNNNGIGDSYTCVARNDAETEWESLWDDDNSSKTYSFSYTITNTPIEPEGMRNLYVRFFSGNECDGVADGEIVSNGSAWTANGGPMIIWKAIEIEAIDPSYDYEVDIDSSVSGNLFEDSDNVWYLYENGTNVQAVNFTQPSHGTLSDTSTDGSFTYTPAGGYAGEDSFQYQISWTRSNGQTAYKTVTVPITVQSGVVLKEITLTNPATEETVDLLDPDRTALTIAPGAPVELEITMYIAGNQASYWRSTAYRFDSDGLFGGVNATRFCIGSGNIHYNEDGTYTLTYTIANTPISPEGVRYLQLRHYTGQNCGSWTGGNGPTNYADAVEVYNDTAPGLVAADDFSYSVAMNGTLEAEASVLNNDAPASNPRTASLIGGSETEKGGTIDLNSDGTFTYVPATGFHGIDTFQYQMNYKRTNGVSAVSNTATVYIVVGASVNDDSFDFGVYGTEEDNGNTVLTVPQALTLSTSASAGTAVAIEIPANTTLTAEGDEDWDGIIDLVPVANSSVTVNPPAGQRATVTTAIEIGLGSTPITFSKPVKLTFFGHAGSLVGWTRGGALTPITNTCNSATNPTNLGGSGDCKIDVGNNLVVWTTHLTTYAAYTQTTISSGGSGSGSRSGGGGGGAVSGPTIAELQAQLASLQAKLAALLGQSGAVVSSGVRDLDMDMEGEDVRALQNLLIGLGYSIPPGATGYFGTYTRDALAAYQGASGIAPSAGYFGAKTRAQMKAAGLQGLWW